MTADQIDNMVDRWIVPGVCQGQIIEVAYGSDCECYYWRRSTDRSDGSVSYARCHLEDLDEWEPWNFEPPDGDHWEVYVIQQVETP